MRASLRLIVALLTLSLVVISASWAFAQPRVPDRGMWALGGSVGAGVPSDPSLANGVDLAGNLEAYATPRVSIRGQFGGTWADITGRGFTGTITPMYLDGNIVYNWEGGVLHPFVTGGVGVYRYHSSITAAPAMNDTRPGLDVGGGLEVFYNRRTTMTIEGLYHAVDQFNTPVGVFNNGQFWTFGVGLKRYWR